MYRSSSAVRSPIADVSCPNTTAGPLRLVSMRRSVYRSIRAATGGYLLKRVALTTTLRREPLVFYLEAVIE